MASSLNGTGLTFSTGATLNSPPVTSVATGNGLAGGTITTTGTLTLGSVATNTIGSYITASISSSTATSSTIQYGTQLAASYVNQTGRFRWVVCSSCGSYYTLEYYAITLSGTWQFMGTNNINNPKSGLFVRVA